MTHTTPTTNGTPTHTGILYTPELHEWAQDSNAHPEDPTATPDADAAPAVIFGAFIGTQDDPAAPHDRITPANVFIAGWADGELWTYAPIGQHSGAAWQYLHTALLIHPDAYATAAGTLYTPPAYLEAIRTADLHGRAARMLQEFPDADTEARPLHLESAR